MDGSVSDGRFLLLDAIFFLSLAAENFFLISSRRRHRQRMQRKNSNGGNAATISTAAVFSQQTVSRGRRICATALARWNSTVSPNARDFEFRASSADEIGASQMTSTITAPL